MANNSSSSFYKRVIDNVRSMRNAVENMRWGDEAHDRMPILSTAEGNIELPMGENITSKV